MYQIAAPGRGTRTNHVSRNCGQLTSCHCISISTQCVGCASHIISKVSIDHTTCAGHYDSKRCGQCCVVLVCVDFTQITPDCQPLCGCNVVIFEHRCTAHIGTIACVIAGQYAGYCGLNGVKTTGSDEIIGCNGHN